MLETKRECVMIRCSSCTAAAATGGFRTGPAGAGIALRAGLLPSLSPLAVRLSPSSSELLLPSLPLLSSLLLPSSLSLSLSLSLLLLPLFPGLGGWAPLAAGLTSALGTTVVCRKYDQQQMCNYGTGENAPAGMNPTPPVLLAPNYLPGRQAPPRLLPCSSGTDYPPAEPPPSSTSACSSGSSAAMKRRSARITATLAKRWRSTDVPKPQAASASWEKA